MSKRTFFQYKPLLLLIAFLFVWWISPVLLKQTMRTTFYELQAPSWVLNSVVKDVQSFWSAKLASKNRLIATGRDMARLNGAYELVLQENAMLKYELGLLEQLLHLPDLEQYRYEVARVSRRDIHAWWHHLMIRKGARHGIPKGAGVVFRGGVVGRVVEVHAFTSVIELVSSPNFRIAGHFEGDARPVTFQGRQMAWGQVPVGEASQVPLDVQGLEGGGPNRLVTSRLGGIFPDGVTIGYVDGLSSGTDGLFAHGRVRLNPALTELQEVAVLIPIESEYEA